MQPPPPSGASDAPLAVSSFPDRPPSQPDRPPSQPDRAPSRPDRAPSRPDRAPPPRAGAAPRRAPSVPPREQQHDASVASTAWRDCFDACDDVHLPHRNATFRVYSAALRRHSPLVVVFLHGGGQCALSWALVARRLKPFCAVLAFDARAHGDSAAHDESDLSARTQVADAAALLSAVFERRAMEIPKLVICGHSMGGAIAVRLCAARLLPNVVGLVVIDVVEGTAMTALPFMSSWLHSRVQSFASVSTAVRYVTHAGHVRNPESARMSVPPQIRFDEHRKRWVWRTRLEHSDRYWNGWFQGLSSLFLSVNAAKMLVLANVDRLDKHLMIAQMQGKFQNILIPSAGHAVHEDQPDQTARVLLEYLRRNLFLEPADDDCHSPVFQQRRPIPPCC